jgi:N-acetylmuramoyl-L-alanine amidase
MASEAARSPPARARALLQEVERLRTSAYRVEHRPVDALEAIEAAKSLQKLPESGCGVTLRRALLEAELERDPGQAYRTIYAQRIGQTDAECRKTFERALIALSAYEPLPNVLHEIRQAHAPAASASQAPPDPAVARHDDAMLPPATADTSPVRITRVERYGAKDAARIVVFVTRPTHFEIGVVGERSERPRLFVDIGNATFSGNASYDVGGLVERVRLGESARSTRVVVDLSARASRRVFYLPEPFRLVIDVAKDTGNDGDGKRAVRRVVLDPGHGGHDPGATGPGGVREKDVVLDIAHRAAPLLARELGVSTLLTRDGDQFVPLDERTARANAFHADLFLSIHCNASEDAAASGVMTFVLDAGREELSMRLAARENAASSEAAVELANAYARITDPSSRAASMRFAELLQRAAMASLAGRYAGVRNGGVKRAGFYVLAGARMPAVLFETSFISNPNAEAHLNTEDYRQKMADSIVNAVRAYRAGL